MDDVTTIVYRGRGRGQISCKKNPAYVLNGWPLSMINYQLYSTIRSIILPQRDKLCSEILTNLVLAYSHCPVFRAQYVQVSAASLSSLPGATIGVCRQEGTYLPSCSKHSSVCALHPCSEHTTETQASKDADLACM